MPASTPAPESVAPSEPSESGGGQSTMCSVSEVAGCELPLGAGGGVCSSDLDCEGLVCSSGSCALPSCTDGRENGSEGGVDCGGPCPEVCACGGSGCASPDPTCDDGILNQGEGDIDCGGPCSALCQAGERCEAGGDCASDLFCPAASGRCTIVSCADGFLNGSEIQVDCGGGSCPGCPIGAPCSEGVDCADGVCGPNGTCAAPACDDGVRNGTEPSVDCGSNCNACPAGEACSEASDCESRVCAAVGCSEGVERCCQAPACNDGALNGGEPSIDCGNAACGLCPLGRPCAANAVCSSGFCQAGACRVQPCANGILNGSESDTDCGGNDPQCLRCGRGADCRVNSDCASNTCDAGTCVDCGDGVQNGSETAVDCGGTCGSCAGGTCTDDDDCASSACEDGTCCGGELVDCTRCARRLATGIDCASNGAVSTNCNGFLQCLADNIVACETSTASECSDDEDDVCFYGDFGGEAGPGVTLAEGILVDAGCQL